MKALVLSGGGVKGAFQIGVLRELLNHNQNLDYDIYAGISVGALNSGLLATGPLSQTLPKLEKIWFNKITGNSSVWRHHLWNYIFIGICVILLFTFAAFITFALSGPKLLTILFGLMALASFYLPYYSLTHSHSIYDNTPLKELVYDNLDEGALKSSGKQLRVGAVSFKTGRYTVVDEQNNNIRDWILASSAFPIFFPMQNIDGEFWTDGGVVDISPLSDAISCGATEIDVILASPIETSMVYHHDDLPGITGQLMRVIDIMSTEILRNDLYARCSIGGGLKIRIFVPDKNLVNNSLSFNPERIRYMYEEGRLTARRILNK